MGASLKLRETPAISANNVSFGGGDVSTLEAFMSGLEEQRVLYSTHGFEYTLQEEEYFNNQRIIAAGGTPPEPIKEGLGIEAYTQFADAAYLDSFASTTDDESRTQAQRKARALEANGRNAKLKELQERFPDAGIEDMEGLLTRTLQYGVEVNKRGGRRSGALQWIAGFAGGIAPAFDPSVNPGTFGLNLLGGGGKAFIGRILTEAGLGAGVAAIDEFTGVRHNMDLFGIPPTAEQTALNIATGAAAPVALHSIVRGAKRLVKGREAPPPPPGPENAPAAVPDAAPIPPGPPRALPITPAEREILARYAPADATRVAKDLDAIARQHDTYGLEPEDMTPPTETVGSAVRMKSYNSVDPDWLDKAVKPNPQQKLDKAGFGTLGDAARALDSEAFDRFDAATRQLDAAKAELADAIAINADKKAGVTTTLDRLIAFTQKALDAAKSAADKAVLKARLQALLERREPVPKTIRASEPLDVQAMSKRVDSLTAKLDATKPNIERALARASDVWDLSQTQRQAVNETIAKAKGPVAGRGQPFANIPRTGGQTTPTRTQGLPELSGETPKPGENFTEVVGRAQDAKDKQMPKLVEDFKTSVKRIMSDVNRLAEAKKAGKDTTELIKTMDMRLTGTEVDIRDVLDVEVDGVTMRQTLEDLTNDDQALVAITSCSVR